jgi:hypothetical protein
MNQFGLECIYVWKCHKETPYIAILNKNVMFFFYKIGEHEGRTGCVWEGLVPVGGGRMWGKGVVW